MFFFQLVNYEKLIKKMMIYHKIDYIELDKS